MADTQEVSLEAQTGAFVERIFGSLVGATDLFLIDLGRRLGLFEALAEGAQTPGGVAERTACDPRYVQEWLEHQATSGILTVSNPDADPADRLFAIPEAHVEALLDDDSLAAVGALAACAAVLAKPVDWLEAAFRTGAGIPYSRYGEEAVAIQTGFTKPLFSGLLTQEWIPAIPAVADRLTGSPAARVADIACGTGFAAIELAKAYPQITVDGFDSDDTSIAQARKNAAEAGVADRVRFEVRDAATDLGSSGPYDLVTIFEAVHDMARPADALRLAGGVLADDGWLIVADENTGDSFAEPGPLDGFFYAVSVLYCLPQSRAEQPSAAIGTVIRRSTIESLASEAGFSGVEVLPIDNDFWRFYRFVA